MLVDYQATINKFFVSVEAFLMSNLRKSKDAKTATKIAKNINTVQKIRQDLRRYVSADARKQDNVCPMLDGFDCNKNYGSAYVNFMLVLSAIDNYYSEPDSPEYQEKLLHSIKDWYYVKSRCPVRDLVFWLKSAESFAIKR